MPTVFLSHSSRGDDYTQAVRECVRCELQSNGYEVLVDLDTLRPGEEWRSTLYDWLARCDAAVVLLNRKALCSPWVRREVNILLWRRALGSRGSKLPVVPVLLGDVRATDVEKSDLKELEPLEYAQASSSVQTAATAQELAEKILQRFAPLESGICSDISPPMKRWINRVIQYLEKVTVDEALNAAAYALRIEEDAWPRDSLIEGRRQYLAHQLLGRALDGRVKNAVTELAGFMPVEPLKALITLVVPTWVDAEEARKLVTFGNDTPPAVVVVLNARWPQTAAHYIDRAMCCPLNGFRYGELAAVIGEEVVAELVSRGRQAVREMLGIPDPFPIEGQKPDTDEVAFLIVHPIQTRPELVITAIRELQVQFPWLNVIFLTGPQLLSSAQLADGHLDRVPVVLGPLGDQEEVTAARLVNDLRVLPQRVLEGAGARGVA